MNANAEPGSEFQPLMDAIFREKVLRARRQSPEERFAIGLDMFEEGVAWMRDGVRMEHPDLSAEEVDARVAQRFARIRQIQEHGIYRPVPAP